jgi:1,4-dihydroxy-6-naphthoate synthase
MWWPLFARDGQRSRIDTGRFSFERITADIETLNRRTLQDDPLEITAMSCAQYPHVQDRYVLTACGSSMGEKYGPKLVARESLDRAQLRSGNMNIAVPGTRTSAFAALTVMLGKGCFQYEVIPFENIIDRVADESFDAGLVIHEGQLTYQHAGLHLIADMGEWWWSQHRLPLPLGVNAIRRDLETCYGDGTLSEIAATLRRSLEHALKHRSESVQVALEFARGIDSRIADEFIEMYVNKWTLDFGDEGSKAVRVFLKQTQEAGLTPAVDELDWVRPETAIHR